MKYWASTNTKSTEAGAEQKAASTDTTDAKDKL